MDTDRKTLIADAAIALLGTSGARGLTHRGVDAQAGLPEGSTSFYCRTKLDLWRLALLRHAELDLADLAEDEGRMQGRPWTPQRLVDQLAHRVEDWASQAKRARTLARFELFLVAAREPELARIVEDCRRQFLALATQGARLAGLPQPEVVAPLLVTTVDGLLLDRVGAMPGIAGPAVARQLLQRVVGMASGLSPSPGGSARPR